MDSQQDSVCVKGSQVLVLGREGMGSAAEGGALQPRVRKSKNLYSGLLKWSGMTHSSPVSYEVVCQK